MSQGAIMLSIIFCPSIFPLFALYIDNKNINLKKKKDMEKITIDVNHLANLVYDEKYNEAISYLVKKFFAEINLTDKGAMEVAKVYINNYKKIDSELTERDITGIAVITAHDEPQEFFNQIRIALLQVGMNLMEEKDKV